jgi:hypothetical protein
MARHSPSALRMEGLRGLPRRRSFLGDAAGTDRVCLWSDDVDLAVWATFHNDPTSLALGGGRPRCCVGGTPPTWSIRREPSGKPDPVRR